MVIVSKIVTFIYTRTFLVIKTLNLNALIVIIQSLLTYLRILYPQKKCVKIWDVPNKLTIMAIL